MIQSGQGTVRYSLYFLYNSCVLFEVFRIAILVLSLECVLQKILCLEEISFSIDFTDIDISDLWGKLQINACRKR